MWIQKRQAREMECTLELENLNDIIPTDNDILVGKGKPFQLHQGNVKMMKRLQALRPRYDAATTKERRKILREEVMDDAFAKGGRFLKQSTNSTAWILASHDEAY
mmetsp:Transcript_20135/g.56063  ORF Transcript_20135/g.56063 Transcript_20135/m.56063 type:complete len:105 (+) Transcript_20135:1210-1524(+)